MDTSVIELGDIACELNHRYSSVLRMKDSTIIGKRERSKIFLSILDELFLKYGQNLGYENIHDFRKDIQFCRRNIKRVSEIRVSTLLEQQEHCCSRREK